MASFTKRAYNLDLGLVANNWFNFMATDMFPLILSFF